MTNPFSWAVNQLANAQRVERKVPRFNPRPPGVIHAGSASEAVLRVLRDNPRTYFTNGALMRETGRSHAAVSWALKYLREQGLVKAIGDPSRNERWLKYAAVIGATDVEVAAKPGAEAGPKRLVLDAQAMPQPEGPGLGVVRRSGNQDLPAVAGELRPVPGGHGTSAESQALAWQEGHQQALHAGERVLDRAHTADEPAPVLPQGDRARPDDDSGRGCTTAGTADLVDRGAPLGSGLQPGAPEAGQALQALHVDHAPGRDAAPARMGQATRTFTERLMEANQERHAAQQGLFSADAQANQDLIPILKAIAA